MKQIVRFEPQFDKLQSNLQQAATPRSPEGVGIA